MATTAATDAVYSAIEESCALINVPYSRDRVEPVLSGFGEGVSGDSVIVMCMAEAAHGGDVDYNFTVPTSMGDPYKIAVERALIEPVDHPVADVLSEVAQRCPVTFFGVECGVVRGFKKTYVFFPLDQLGDLSVLAELPSMPKALSANLPILARHGLDKRISIVGIDYIKCTVNIYFMARELDRESISSLMADLGIPEPDEPELLDFVCNSFSVYPTFNWESDQAERICFSSVSPDDHAYPTTVDADIARFTRNAPHEYPGDRVLVYGPTITPAGVYHKLGVYYRRPDSFWRNLPLAARFQQLVTEKNSKS